MRADVPMSDRLPVHVPVRFSVAGEGELGELLVLQAEVNRTVPTSNKSVLQRMRCAMQRPCLIAVYAGIARSGMGRPTNSRRVGFAIHRAHWADRPTRALSVAMPVLAYIWRYNFDTSTKASRAFIDSTQRERSQILGRL